jgi:Leucine-rich repeat (LRR) protein
MALSPRNMPANTDGQAHLFFTGDQPIQIMAVSNTGCIAIQSPGNPIKVYHWYFRSKGKELITLDPVPWAIVWSCRAPWNAEQCGYLARLQVDVCGLTQIHVRDLNFLAHLRCAGNLLERLDCSRMSSLKSLDCSGNHLTSVDLSGCSQLRRLRVGGNPRLRTSASDLLAHARGEPQVIRRQRATSTSLFDL